MSNFSQIIFGGGRFPRWEAAVFPEMTSAGHLTPAMVRNGPLEEKNLANEAVHATILAKMSARCDEHRKELR
jgi:hypothetical protein